jgi:hypothetical protein
MNCRQGPALIALALAACGGDGADAGVPDSAAERSAAAAAGSEDTVHACDLLTAADVESVFGAPAQPAEDLNREGQCGYWAPETGAVGVTLRLSRGAEFRSSWASDEMREMSDVQDVNGLGEAAVWVADMDMLAVLVDDRTLVLVGAGDRDAKRRIMERVLANE